MEKNEIKEANRKAMPKFFLLMIVGAFAGGVIGFIAAEYGVDGLADRMKDAGAFFGKYVSSWILLVIAVIMPIAVIPFYKNVKNLLTEWDGEDESVCDIAERKINIILLITSIAMISNFFLIAATYSGGFAIFESGGKVHIFALGIVAFLVILAECIVVQQKAVDLTKIMYPEKTASVYDVKFQKKWVESCDEAEKIMIGKCAFEAYKVTNTLCGILAVLLAVSALTLNIGFLPSFVVCLIWLVNQCVYCWAAAKCSKVN